MKPAAVALPPSGLVPSPVHPHCTVPWPATAPFDRPQTHSARARERMLEPGAGPLFTADWRHTVMIHFALPAERLQPIVPFELDLWRGAACVSLVAFTQTRLRPAPTHWTGRLLGGNTRMGQILGRAVLAPIGHHEFLNIRTYVRHRDEAGIFFIAEFLANRLAPFLGLRLYGLPYAFGRIDYGRLDQPIRGTVVNPRTGRQLEYTGAPTSAWGEFQPAPAGTLDEFCLERYTAFTERRGVLRRFRIWHEPWQQKRVDAQVTVDHLVQDSGAWFGAARLVAANQSPGVENVWIGPPQRVER